MRKNAESEGEGDFNPLNKVKEIYKALAPELLPAFGIAIFLVITLSGCHSDQSLNPQQLEGQHLYEVRCAHCHEENDLGLKPPPPNIHGAMNKPTLPSGAPATDAEVRRLVLLGKNKMPAFQGRFTELQMAALLSYLHTSMPAPKT